VGGATIKVYVISNFYFYFTKFTYTTFGNNFLKFFTIHTNYIQIKSNKHTHVLQN